MKREILGSEGCHNMWPSWTCDWIVNNRTIKHNPFKSQNHEVGLNSKILPVATNTSDCSRPENCCIIVWSVHWMTSLSQAQTQENADCGRDGCARFFFFFLRSIYQRYGKLFQVFTPRWNQPGAQRPSMCSNKEHKTKCPSYSIFIRMLNCACNDSLHYVNSAKSNLPYFMAYGEDTRWLGTSELRTPGVGGASDEDMLPVNRRETFRDGEETWSL